MDDSSADQATLKDTSVPASTPEHWFSHVIESRFLFPVIAVLALAAIWGTTLTLSKNEYADAERAAAESSRKQAEIFEAQVVRALREIDLTLKIVKSAYEVWGLQNVLPKLKARNLLPPGLVFDVSIANNRGEIVDSTDPKEMTHIANRIGYLNRDQADVMSIGLPQLGSDTGEWHLHFSRRVTASDGKSLCRWLDSAPSHQINN